MPFLPYRSATWITLFFCIASVFLGLYFILPRANGSFTIVRPNGKKASFDIRHCHAGNGPTLGFFGIGMYDSSGASLLFHDRSLTPAISSTILIAKDAPTSTFAFTRSDCSIFEPSTDWIHGNIYSDYYDKVSGSLEVPCRNADDAILQANASFTRCPLEKTGL